MNLSTRLCLRMYSIYRGVTTMIDINFDKAYAQAAGMAQCAEGIAQQNKKLNNLIEDLRKAWQGETSLAYIRKLEEFNEALGKEAKSCNNAAETFRAKIDEIKKADELMAAAVSATLGPFGIRL